MQDIKSTKEKHGPASQAILMTMRTRRYGAERITQYSRSRATLDASGCRHQASIRPVSPRRTPWPSILAKIFELWVKPTEGQLLSVVSMLVPDVDTNLMGQFQIQR